MGAKAVVAVVVMAVTLTGGAAHARCTGDCKDDGSVTVDDVLLAVNVALGTVAVSECLAADVGGDGQVTVDELVQAVDNALNGCPIIPPDQLVVPEDFSYDTKRDVQLDITVRNANGDPFSNVIVMVFDGSADSTTEDNMILRGMADVNGHFSDVVGVPAYYTRLRVIVSAIGIASDAMVPITDGVVSYRFE